jgi:hypothetical protein
MLILALGACDSPTSDPVERDIEMLRAATEPFQSFAAAQAANYTLLFADMCMEHATDGAMGYHYVNTELLDGEVAVRSPEALLYESGQNGELELVAVEYVIPFAVRPEDQPPPVLFGQEFRQNHTYDLWTLHAWVWKDNPAGVFADWNASVTCP